jgi:murein L,D-transpeptidase YafK
MTKNGSNRGVVLRVLKTKIRTSLKVVLCRSLGGWGAFACAIFIAASVTFAQDLAPIQTPSPGALDPASDLWPADLLQISSTEAFSKHVLLVDKAQRKLLIFERSGESIHKIFDVSTDIGKNGGNKTRRDDQRTPEGIYIFQKKLTQPEIPFDQYGKIAFTTDYPNFFDRMENKTGSGIWLHSIPETVALTRGSRGCVVVRNEVVEKLQSYIKLKETPLIIYDKLDYLTKEEHNRRRVKMTEYLDSWVSAWQSMDVEKYLTYYDEKFTAPGFNLRSWKKHKENLKNKYKYIKVTLSQPFVLLHRDQLIIKTLQKYESNEHSDYGVKTIYAAKRGEGYKILREEWVPAQEDGTVVGVADSSMPR